MSYKIEVTDLFEKQLKKLVKRYPSLKTEYFSLITSLETSPQQGSSLGNSCYKIRISIASKGKGKSGGARVITHVQVVKQKVYLLSIYDKSEQSTVSDSEIADWLKILP